eukprot:3084398-Prorocentrum_lima.AAC.1
MGVMITRAKNKDQEFQEGYYYVGQGAYTLEVCERFGSSMNYEGRMTPWGTRILLQISQGTS